MTWELPPPNVLGLPVKFASWRPMQAEAVLRAAGVVDTGSSPTLADQLSRRFQVLGMPTGSGKSLAYMAAAYLLEDRVAILTSTKGLQRQLETDFKDGSAGLVVLAGKNAYPCVAEEGRIGCDKGQCNYGLPCPHKAGCEYYKAVDRAKSARIVVTNYAMWYAVHEYGEGLGDFGMLVLDEAHQAPNSVASALSVVVDEDEAQELSGDMPDPREGIATWVRWAEQQARMLSTILEAEKGNLKAGMVSLNPRRKQKMDRMRRLMTSLNTLVEAGGLIDEWVVETEEGDNRPDTVGRRRNTGRRAAYGGYGGYGSSNTAPPKVVLRMDPVWPGRGAERYLFRGVPRVVLTSATVVPKTLRLLGVDEPDMAFWECDNPFPVVRRPIYWVDTIRLNARSTESDLRLWVSRIDQILRSRPGVKGLVHTTSYARKEFLLANSREKARMVGHNSHDTVAKVREFKDSAEPLVLVSPSMTTGWDFPYEQCRFQVIGKVPFPDTRDAITRTRCRLDPEYRNYLTAQALVQAYGRGVRAEDDWCECFVVDDNLGWFLKQAEALVPKWFRAAVSRHRTIPMRK